MSNMNSYIFILHIMYIYEYACVCVCVCIDVHTHTHTLSTEELTIVNHSVANIPHNLNSELSSLVSYKHNYEHI